MDVDGLFVTKCSGKIRDRKIESLKIGVSVFPGRGKTQFKFSVFPGRGKAQFKSIVGNNLTTSVTSTLWEM